MEKRGTPMKSQGERFSFFNYKYRLKSIEDISSVTQSCLTLWDPMDCSTPGLPVHHQLPEFSQIHVHWVGDAIQPSHPLSSPSPPALNLSQNQGLSFSWSVTKWSVQFSSVVQSCPTLCDPMNCSMPGLPVHHQLLEFTQTHAHWVSDAIKPSHPLSSPSPPAPNPSQYKVFSNESTLRMKWPKNWSFSFSISPFNKHLRLISIRMDWLDFLAVQGILKSLLQHHSSKASILQCSAFFLVQLSHPYMTTGKTIALN